MTERALDDGRDLQREAELPSTRTPRGRQRLGLARPDVRRLPRRRAVGGGRRQLAREVLPHDHGQHGPVGQREQPRIDGRQGLRVGRVEQTDHLHRREARAFGLAEEDLRPERATPLPGRVGLEALGRRFHARSPSGPARSSCSPRRRRSRFRSGRRPRCALGSASASCAPSGAVTWAVAFSGASMSGCWNSLTAAWMFDGSVTRSFVPVSPSSLTWTKFPEGRP